jgi:hypothetical protein
MRTVVTVAGVLGLALLVVGSPAGTPLALDVGQPEYGSSDAGTASLPSYFTAAERTAPDVADEDLNAVVQQYCVMCHGGPEPMRDLSLEGFDIDEIDQNAEVGEKMIKKLRAGMMPPPGMPRPAGDTLLALVEEIEETLDDAVDRNRNAGARPSQRLNRPEYELAIRELLGLDVNAGDWLPLDTKSANFDNIADVQGVSTLLVEAYMNAASEVSRMAVGDRNAAPVKKQYTNSDYVSQQPWDHVPGAPYGTRGGMVVTHVFPADGYYTFQMTFGVRGNTNNEDVDVSIDGERVALLHYDPSVVTGVDADGRGANGGLFTERIFVRAGQRTLSAAFVRTTEGPFEDLVRPHEWSLAGLNNGTGATTQHPHMRDLVVDGPFDVTGLSDTPSRQKIFSCRPTVASEERSCARTIVERLGSEAFRRPLTSEDVDGLMAFYDMGVERGGGFEPGVRMALEAILAHPSFYYRLERQPDNARDGRNYDLADLELATRLSFFLWGTPPDEELIAIANRGRLSGRTLEEQTRRMLADPRAEALGTRFAAQWLRLQDLYKVRPDPNFFPNFDQNIADAMHRETELFFYNLVKEDRSLLEAFTADYTFVNERLARHYGIPNVAGNYFRKVQYPDATRRGILGQGSILVQTSLADRTSPVLRGKWVMEVLLGTPPPPPPPNVPTLAETGESNAGQILTTRQRMEIHRANPTCNSCHRFMDPIGLSLDNFDVMGKWRYRENGAELDTRGELYDGTQISNPSELIDALLKRPIPLVRQFTENLMTYALGRRLEAVDMPTVRAITQDAEENDYRLSSFILGVVNSDAFQMRRAEVAQDADGQ